MASSGIWSLSNGNMSYICVADKLFMGEWERRRDRAWQNMCFLPQQRWQCNFDNRLVVWLSPGKIYLVSHENKTLICGVLKKRYRKYGSSKISQCVQMWVCLDLQMVCDRPFSNELILELRTYDVLKRLCTKGGKLDNCEVWTLYSLPEVSEQADTD